MFEKNGINFLGYSDEETQAELLILIEGTGIYEDRFREEWTDITDQYLFSVEVYLFPGINKVHFQGRTILVYYDEKLEKTPPEFERIYSHSEPDCDNCHRMIPGFNKRLTGEVNEVCEECHDKVEGKAEIHPGFEDSTCVDCHDPHFSKHKGHLQAKVQNVCYECHDDVTKITGRGNTKIHPPVEVAGCAKCHDPHASDNEHFLVMKKYELCATCHSEPRDYGHKDNYDDCTLCHEHHASKNLVLLKEEYWDNCLDCHDEVADQKFRHQPKGRGCGDCHDPHSDTDLENVITWCTNCHGTWDEGFSRFHGGLTISIKKCFKCHMPHDAYNKRLLKSQLHFPLTQAGNCVACHDIDPDSRENKVRIPNKAKVCFKCHGDMKPFEEYDNSIHPQVISGDCVRCHSPHLKLKRKQLLVPVERLCYKCHENYVEKAQRIDGGSLHLPVEENECLECHDPHQSKGVSLLKTSLMNALCFECHEESITKVKRRKLIHYHYPPTDMICTACHLPHLSKKENLLKRGH